MKILRVVSDLYPYVVGGLGIHTHEMSRCQAQYGHDVTVYTSKNSNPVKNINKNYQVVKFNNRIKIAGNSLLPGLFFKLIQEKHNFDIIHAHSHLFLSTNQCALIRKLKSTPLVITNHGLISQTVPMKLQKIYLPTIGKWTFQSADKVITYTEEGKSSIINLGVNPDKIEVIHNGIDTNLFTPKQQESKNKQLLWVGRYIHGKGVQYLIEAFKIVSEEYDDLKLLMVGDGPLKENINKQINHLGLNRKITQKKFIPNSEIPDLYRNSDIFVLPSLEEGVPRTILEAMSCEIPVVCTKLPQLIDIINECGIMVPKKDPEALAEGIIKILSDKSLSLKFGKNGRYKIINGFSWENTVKKTLKLYETLI
ncbi:glycosyltransferase family 4 protein [Methanobacterium spitsbergense]|uniref:Glycosyltransferase family 4 protein n=1 Tax=Methanobacterium spitsbergense TaxID=2874285 RepID=A0A8T5URK2_9EURY|nr:glycosyltransferase family 4 protein [Methanobacterium spitsbergense]